MRGLESEGVVVGLVDLWCVFFFGLLCPRYLGT